MIGDQQMPMSLVRIPLDPATIQRLGEHANGRFRPGSYGPDWIEVDDEVLDELRRRAARENKTVQQVIHELVW